jgi:acyl carrier protein
MGVAMGYWGKPDMTAERFIPDPFSIEDRLYKTGDLVRYCEDGSLRFAGRIDRQIKLHGHRIEPGEIEVALARHPAVKEVSVVLVGMKGEQRLAAYVECHNGQRNLLSELRKLAAETLPAYMIPAHFVFLDRLPRGVPGKIDRTALLPFADGHGEVRDPFVEPRDECERDIAAIWQALLGTGRVGVQQSFFELGGHSLLAMQLVSRIRQRFAVEVPLRTLFEAPTVEALAQIVKKPKRYSSKDTLPPIRRLSRDSNRLDMATTD